MSNKRKRESASPTTSTPINKRLRSILKSDDSPRSLNRSVSFKPPEQLPNILSKISNGKFTTEDVEMLSGEIENCGGNGLVIWLKELSENIRVLGKPLAPVVEQVLLIPWIEESQEVVKSYQEFLLHLLSAHTIYTKAVVRALLRLFIPKPGEGAADVPQQMLQLQKLQQPKAFQNVHIVLKGILRISNEGKAEVVRQINTQFPYFKHPPHKLIPYVLAVTDIAAYLPLQQQQQVLEILLEKVIQLDASLGRSDVVAYVKSKEEEDGEEGGQAEPSDINNRLVLSLDLYMSALFRLVNTLTQSEDGVYCEEKGETFSQLLLKLFRTFIIPTHKICHVQYLYFYLANQNSKLAKRFLNLNWEIFSSVNSASIIRQAAVSYLAGFVCRAECVGVKALCKYLDKLCRWIHKYMQADRTLKVDYMHANLSAHGSFYSACQAAFYIVAFRHHELTVNDDLSYLRSLQLSSIVTHPLNPLRVMTPGVVKEFSKVVAHYQLAYCKTVLHRNSRITLPVVGLSSSGMGSSSGVGGGKPLLLDNYFPFDPYHLPQTKGLIDSQYRKHQDHLEDSSSSEEEDEDDEEVEEEENEEDEDEGKDESDGDRNKALHPSRRRRTSSCSNNSSISRTRKISLSEVILNEVTL